MRNMRAAVFEGEGRLILKDVPVPTIQKIDQVLVRVEAASICGTDVHITRIPMSYPATPGIILGHEFVGIVEDKGEFVPNLEIGNRVVINPNASCGYCHFCRRSLPNHCEHIEAMGIDYNGAFAQYCVVNANSAFRIGENVSSGAASCAEPLACAINGLKKISVLPGDNAVVIGAGPIGIILAFLLRRSGAEQITILEPSVYRRNFAQTLGFDALDPSVDDALKGHLEQNPYGSDIVIDATGSQIAQTIRLVRKGGSALLFGVNKKAVPQIRQSDITTKEISLFGTWLANATFPDAVRLLESGRINFDILITDEFSLENLSDGIEKLARGDAVKVIVKP